MAGPKSPDADTTLAYYNPELKDSDQYTCKVDLENGTVSFFMERGKDDTVELGQAFKIPELKNTEGKFYGAVSMFGKGNEVDLLDV